MPHGQVDFGAYAVKETVSSLADMGELAARLGSIVTFDRRGDVIWFDDFQSGFNAEVTAFEGASAKAEWCSEEAFRGGFSGHLVAGPAADDNIWIGWRLAYPALSKMGCELAFSFDGHAKEIELWFRLYGAGKTPNPKVKWIAADKTWSYLGDDNIFHVIEPVQDIRHHIDTTHVVKLVVDFVKGEYVRLISGEHEYDLSKYACHFSDFRLAPYLLVNFGVSTDGVDDANAYMSHGIVTQNEP
ncbi:hypothetical protein ES708_09885 [subsurface metagenome]